MAELPVIEAEEAEWGAWGRPSGEPLDCAATDML